MSKLDILKEFWEFLRARKKWWLLPIVIFLLLLGALLILTEGSVIAPFIYPIFEGPGQGRRRAGRRMPGCG